MNLKIDLNIYQLPENKLVARFKVPDDWDLKKILAFARDQLISNNRLCRVATVKNSLPNTCHCIFR